MREEEEKFNIQVDMDEDEHAQLGTLEEFTSTDLQTYKS